MQDSRFWRILLWVGLIHALFLGIFSWFNHRKTSPQPLEAGKTTWLDPTSLSLTTSAQETVMSRNNNAIEETEETYLPPPQPLPPESFPEVPPAFLPPVSTPKNTPQSTPKPIPKPTPQLSPKKEVTPHPSAKATPKPISKSTPQPSPKKEAIPHPSPKATSKTTPPLKKSAAATPSLSKKEESQKENSSKKKTSTSAVEKANNAPPTTPKKEEGDKRKVTSATATTGTNSGSGASENPSQYGWYNDLIHDRFYGQWDQPTSLFDPQHKFSCILEIQISKEGNIMNYHIVRGSGNEVLDRSVLDAATRIKQIDPLPAGLSNKGIYIVRIEFELGN